MKGKNKYFIQDGMISRFDFMDNQEFMPLPTVCALLNDNEKKYDKLAKKLAIVGKALELACEEYSKLYCWHHCSYDKEKTGFVCGCCENGDYKFFKDNFLEMAKEIINGYKQDD